MPDDDEGASSCGEHSWGRHGQRHCRGAGACWYQACVQREAPHRCHVPSCPRSPNHVPDETRPAARVTSRAAEEVQGLAGRRRRSPVSMEAQTPWPGAFNHAGPAARGPNLPAGRHVFVQQAEFWGVMGLGRGHHAIWDSGGLPPHQSCSPMSRAATNKTSTTTHLLHAPLAVVGRRGRRRGRRSAARPLGGCPDDTGTTPGGGGGPGPQGRLPGRERGVGRQGQCRGHAAGRPPGDGARELHCVCWGGKTPTSLDKG